MVQIFKNKQVKQQPSSGITTVPGGGENISARRVVVTFRLVAASGDTIDAIARSDLDSDLEAARCDNSSIEIEVAQRRENVVGGSAKMSVRDIDVKAFLLFSSCKHRISWTVFEFTFKAIDFLL